MANPTPPAGAKPTSGPKIDQAAANKIAEALKAMAASAKKIKTATAGADVQAAELDKVK